MLSCSFFLSFGLARDCLLRERFLVIFGKGVQFQCRLFRLVQALIFGALAFFIWAMTRSLWFFYLVVLDGLCLVLSVLIIAGFVTLVGRGVVMGSSLGLGKVLLSFFQNELGSAGALLAGTLPLRSCTTRFAGRMPTWRLPVLRHVACLVTAGVEVPGSLEARFLVEGITGLVVLVLQRKFG